MNGALVLSDGRTIPGWSTPTGMAVDIDRRRKQGHGFVYVGDDAPDRFIAIHHIVAITRPVEYVHIGVPEDGLQESDLMSAIQAVLWDHENGDGVIADTNLDELREAFDDYIRTT